MWRPQKWGPSRVMAAGLASHLVTESRPGVRLKRTLLLQQEKGPSGLVGTGSLKDEVGAPPWAGDKADLSLVS